MRTLHLFAGIGGGIYADLILGHEPVHAVEWDPYCCAVLREKFPGLHVVEDDVLEWLMSMRSALDSLVPISAQQVKERESPESVADCIVKSCEQLTLLSLDGCSLRTAPIFDAVDAIRSSEILFRVDIPGATESCPRLLSERPTKDLAGGFLLPTPTATTSKQGAGSKAGGRSQGKLLLHASLKNWWPTPISSDWKSHSPSKLQGNSRPLREIVGQMDHGPLNPTWVEWLMGFPTDSSASKLWATHKSRCKQPSRGDCSADHNNKEES